MAICIRCGTVKKRPIDECRVCHFQPQTPEERAKSVIVSTYYDIEDDYRGKTRDELLAIAPLIASGQYAFDAQEVAAVAQYGEAVSSLTARRLLIDLVKWIGPPFLLLGGLLTIIWLTR